MTITHIGVALVDKQTGRPLGRLRALCGKQCETLLPAGADQDGREMCVVCQSLDQDGRSE